jgi:MFS transporter, PAT family, solute carrier family 33 (acetyl-CoA transportor), member 1
MSGSIERKRSKSVLVIDDNETEKHEGKKQNDLHGIILLIILYVLQGIPLGLSMGSVPFLLKKKLGYAELAIFSLTGYPYSLKLLWSPIVDSVFSARIGRRKSWIVPTQFAVGLFLLWISAVIDDILVADTVDVYFLTFLFFGLVLLSATQDIAVDGLSSSSSLYSVLCAHCFTLLIACLCCL